MHEEGILAVFASRNLILIYLGLYVALILGLGLFYSRRIKDHDDLVVAGRSLGFFYLVPSILATWICAGAMMGAAGQAFLFGMQGVIFDPWAPALGMVIIGLFFASRMRQARYTTITDYFNQRYGSFSGLLYTIVQILAALAWVGGQLVALGIILHLTTGLERDMAVFLAALAIIIVTACGGLWALSRVDTFAFLLILGGLLFLLPASLGEMGGGGVLIQNAANWAELPPWSMRLESGEEGYLWYTGILGLLLYISAWASLSLGDVPSQVLMQRALAARTARVARSSFLTAGVLYLIVGMIPVIIGITIFSSGYHGDLDVSQAEFILPWAANSFLPAPAAALMILALAAAIISTAGDTVLVVSTLISHNLYGYLRPDASSKSSLHVARAAVPLVTLFAAMVALYFESVYRLIVLSGGIQLATIAGAYLIGFFWKGANSKGAVGSFFAGLVTWVVLYRLILPHTIEANMDIVVVGEPYMTWAIEDAIFIAMIPAAVVSFLSLIIISLLTGKDRDYRATELLSPK